jgi:YegS/Rv2252/BmrU family lipid kinase
MRSAVVVNPSKVVDLDGRRAEICAALAAAGWPEPLWLPTTPEDPGRGQTRQAVRDGVDVVFACGGDGTVMACATELAGTRVALAVLPSGTGNLLAANLGLPNDVPAAVAVATGGVRRRIDVGSCDEHCFTVMAGMGFDAAMLDASPDGLKARLGWPAYILGGLRRLRDRPMRIRIRLDGGEALRRRARTVLIANVGRLQGGIELLPGAQPDDGLFEVAILSPRHLRDWLALAVAVLRRRPRVPRMETFRATRVEVLSNKPQLREVDGDVIAPGQRLRVVLRPAALTVCVPAQDPSVKDAPAPAGPPRRQGSAERRRSAVRSGGPDRTSYGDGARTG